jgi:hypothetical protein
MGLSVYIPRDDSIGQASGDTTLGNVFMQERVALYGFGGFLLAFTLLVLRVASALAIGRLYLTHPSFLLHVLCMLTYLAVWLMARRGRYGMGAIRALDYAGYFSLPCGSSSWGRSCRWSSAPSTSCSSASTSC